MNCFSTRTLNLLSRPKARRLFTFDAYKFKLARAPQASFSHVHHIHLLTLLYYSRGPCLSSELSILLICLYSKLSGIYHDLCIEHLHGLLDLVYVRVERLVIVVSLFHLPPLPYPLFPTCFSDSMALDNFFQNKIEDAKLEIVAGQAVLRRLEAQRNDYNSRVRLLREELGLLQQPGSYVGEVVKVMGTKKVLVKVHPEGKYGKLDCSSMRSTPR